MTTDLYAELGVDRTASETDIRRAYRRRAKRAHPDGGGSREAFDRLQVAHDVLCDAEKRAVYDETGQIAPSLADNAESSAFEVIGQLIIGFLNGDDDPTQMDLRAAMIAHIRAMLTEVGKLTQKAERAKKRAEKLIWKFKKKADKSPTPIDAMLRHQIKVADAQITKHGGARTSFERAIAILEAMDFEQDWQDLAILAQRRPGYSFVGPLAGQSAYASYFSNSTS